MLREALKTITTNSSLSGAMTNLVTHHFFIPDTKYLNVLMTGSIYFYDDKDLFPTNFHGGEIDMMLEHSTNQMCTYNPV